LKGFKLGTKWETGQHHGQTSVTRINEKRGYLRCGAQEFTSRRDKEEQSKYHEFQREGGFGLTAGGYRGPAETGQVEKPNSEERKEKNTGVARLIVGAKKNRKVSEGIKEILGFGLPAIKGDDKKLHKRGAFLAPNKKTSVRKSLCRKKETIGSMAGVRDRSK